MRRLILLFVVFLLISSLTAKIKIAYPLMSIVIPGSGEIALGKINRGIAMLSMDILTNYAYMNNQIDYRNSIKSYKGYAHVRSGAPINQSNEYYQFLQNYYSSDDFNQQQEMLARNYFLIYQYDPEGYEAYITENTFTSDEAWHWQDQSSWLKYKSMRQQTQNLKIKGNLALGLLIFNRVVSAIDVTLVQKNKTHTTDIKVFLSPLDNNSVMLNCNVQY